jgi:chromosome segregation ATPase
MTRSRYIIAAILRNFGLVRKTKRLTDAAFEIHLMQDGEEILGAFCWPETESIEDLSLPYWNLRRLESEKKEIVEKVTEAEKILTGAQQQKFDSLVMTRIKENPFTKQKSDLKEVIRELNAEHDALMSKALSSKNRHAALKMKLEVLQKESKNDKASIEACLQDLASLRKTFIKEKQDLEDIKERIGVATGGLEQLGEGASQSLQGSEAKTKEAYEKISQANRDISNHRAKLGLIDEERAALHRKIGHFLNLNAERKDCRIACRKHRALLRQVQLLLASIRLNHKLAGR